MSSRFLLVFAVCAGLPAQQVQPKAFLRDFAADQAAIWSSPKHAGRNLAWIAPLAAATGALIATDHLSTSAIPADWAPPSVTVSNAGIAYMAGVPATLALTGVVTHNRKETGTGVLAAEALADAEAVVTVLKYATMRQRPPDGGHFWRPNGDPSFPSGHSIGIWAVSSVVAAEYRSRPVAIAAYSAAAAVSLSRFTAQRHQLSDVLVGSAMGWLIGHYVARVHRLK